PFLDLDHNELALVYRARGLDDAAADARAATTIRDLRQRAHARDVGTPGRDRAFPAPPGLDSAHDPGGSAWSAAGFSFLSFAAGALIPVLPYAFGASGWVAAVIAAALVGVALLGTGSITGILSGGHPWLRALRQLGI